jgi:hypothetical protein
MEVWFYERSTGDYFALESILAEVIIDSLSNGFPFRSLESNISKRPLVNEVEMP